MKEKVKKKLKEKKPKNDANEIITKARLQKHDPQQSAHDTTEALSTNYIKELIAITANHSFMRRPYYIIAHLRRDLPIPNQLHLTFVVRRSLPFPDWNTQAWEVDNKTSSMFLWWSLPDEVEAKQVLKRIDLFDTKFFNDCKVVLESDDPISKIQKIPFEV